MLATIVTYVFLALCLALFVVPLWFVANEVYEDGLIGRLGLLGISFAAAGYWLIWCDYEKWPEVPFEVLPPTMLLVAAATVFLIWHLFRFHRKVLRKKQQPSALDS